MKLSKQKRDKISEEIKPIKKQSIEYEKELIALKNEYETKLMQKEI